MSSWNYHAHDRAHGGPPPSVTEISLKRPSRKSRKSNRKSRQQSIALGRDSYGRARSQPPSSDTISKVVGKRSVKSGRLSEYPIVHPTNASGEKVLISTDSGHQIEVSLKESRSVTNISRKVRKSQNKHPLTDDNLENNTDTLVTRHMLYKEAMYTSVHMLGKASHTFPASKEQMCIYSHETFGSSSTEQEAVIDHVKNEQFPLTLVTTVVRKCEDLQSLTENRPPNPYCVVVIETEGSEVVFQLGKKHWQEYYKTDKTPLNKFKLLKQNKKGNVQPEPERRIDQMYEKIPRFIRTKVKSHDRNPVWEQRFQCLSLRPATDILTAEVWDHPDDNKMLKAIQTYTNAANGPDRWSIVSAQGQGEIIENSDPSDKSRRSDEFLGKVTLQVADLPCDGLQNWFHLEGKTNGRDKEAHGRVKLKIWLVHAYRHGKHYTELVEPKVMLECLWDWILCFEKKKHGESWDGSIPQPATCLLFQYALQTGISEDTHAVIRWNAYAKHKLDLQVADVRLKDLDAVMNRRASIKDKENKRHSLTSKTSPPTSQTKTMVSTRSTSEIDESQLEIEETILLLVMNEILPIIRNHLNEPEAKVHEACKSYKKCRDVLSKFEFSPAFRRVNWLFLNAIRLCILEWYQAMFALTVRREEGLENHVLVNYYVEVIKQVNDLVKLGFTKWGPLFWLDTETEYTPIVYDELQKMVNQDIESFCWEILEFYNDNERLHNILLAERKEDIHLGSAVFSLYGYTQHFVEMQQQVFIDFEKPKYDNLNNYHRWFRPILVLWLGYAVVRGSEMITKCVNIDNVSTDNIHSKTSTSALDTATVFHQMVHFWQKLMWPDICENYVIIHFLIEVMCYYTVLYAKRKHEKLELTGYFDTVDRFDISERFCTALNNIEYVKGYLEKIPDEINQGQLLRSLEAECGVSRETHAYRSRLDQVFNLTFMNVEIIFKTILQGVNDRVRPEISKYVEDSLTILYKDDSHENYEEAAGPVMHYLEENIVMLQNSLLDLNFARMLQLFWNVLCEEVASVSLTFKMRDFEEQVKFFTKVLMMLPIFEEYFEGGDAGLSKHERNTEEYQEAHRILTFCTTDTEKLIAIYYGIRGHEQFNERNSFSTTNVSGFGILTVRIQFWAGTLKVDVISASNLTASNDSFKIWQLCKKKTPNNDPFVEVEIQPVSNFTSSRMSQTETKWKTLNPEFNEKFQWDVTLDECLNENAVVVFTVKDYDYLSKNDFLGEAIVPMSMIPGVTDKPIQQPMNLNLRIVRPNSVLNVLKTRAWDGNAYRFYEVQSSRIVQP